MYRPKVNREEKTIPVGDNGVFVATESSIAKLDVKYI